MPLASDNATFSTIVEIVPVAIDFARNRTALATATFDGQEYPGRTALARHLATITGRSMKSCEYLLLKYNDDGARVVEHRTPPPMPPNAKRVTFDGQD